MVSFIEWIKSIICKNIRDSCNETINILTNQINTLQQQNNELAQKLQQLQQKYDEDTQYYEERIKTLTEQLMKSIEMPDLSSYKSKAKLINPRDYIKIPNSAFADYFYLALPLNDWKEVLTKIQNTFKATWTEEVFDCDDFALLFSAMLTYSCYKSNFKNQLALGICWSYTHAYNCFIDSDGKVWIYEPQNNTVIGELGKTPAPYNTIEVWFMSYFHTL